MNLMTVALLLLHTNQILSDSKSYEIKLGSSYSGSIKSGSDTYFKLTSASNAFQSPNIPNNLVYISLTLCSGTSGQDFQEPEIYYSLTDSTPGPNKSEKLKNNFTVENFPNWKVSKAGVPKGILLSTVTLKPKSSNDINLFLGVNLSGKNLDYNYQLGINTGSYFHNYSNQLGLALLDTDDSMASLTIISNDPSKFDNNTQTLYYRNSGGDSLFTTCALQSNNSTVVSSKSDPSKVKLGGKLPPQFMGTEAVISELSRDTTYEAILVNNPSSSGQTTFNPPVSLKTSKYSDCKLMNQLSFCDMVSYSVPIPTHFITKDSNNNNQPTMEIEKAKKTYDDFASGMYKKFDDLIEQYDCDAHIYSPVRNCTDCKAAYKDWLCSMTFPRCSDEHHSTDEAQPHNIHDIIAERDTHDKTKEFLPEELKEVNPYYEIKPCIDLCYYVVQSCPVAFEFTCPEQKSTLNYTYGIGTMQFDNLTAFQSGLGDSSHLGDLPWGCNNMMRSVSNQAFSQSSTLLPLYSIILTILTLICI